MIAINSPLKTANLCNNCIVALVSKKKIHTKISLFLKFQHMQNIYLVGATSKIRGKKMFFCLLCGLKLRKQIGTHQLQYPKIVCTTVLSLCNNKKKPNEIVG